MYTIIHIAIHMYENVKYFTIKDKKNSWRFHALNEIKYIVYGKRIIDDKALFII